MQRKHAVFFSTDLNTEIHWFNKNSLKRELAHAGLGYTDLVDRLPKNDLLVNAKEEDHLLINVLLALESPGI